MDRGLVKSTVFHGSLFRGSGFPLIPWVPMVVPPGGPRGYRKLYNTNVGPLRGPKDAFRIAKMLVKRAVPPTESW